MRDFALVGVVIGLKVVRDRRRASSRSPHAIQSGSEHRPHRWGLPEVLPGRCDSMLWSVSGYKPQGECALYSLGSGPWRMRLGKFDHSVKLGAKGPAGREITDAHGKSTLTVNVDRRPVDHCVVGAASGGSVVRLAHACVAVIGRICIAVDTLIRDWAQRSGVRLPDRVFTGYRAEVWQHQDVVSASRTYNGRCDASVLPTAHATRRGKLMRVPAFRRGSAVGGYVLGNQVRETSYLYRGGFGNGKR